MVKNYNKPMPQGYSEEAWNDHLKEGDNIFVDQLEHIKASVSMDKMLGNIKVQLKQNPKMSIEKIIKRAVDFSLGGIPGKYYPYKGYVGDVRMSLLTVLREKGEKAFVNIIENSEYHDYFDEQDKLEFTKKLAEEDTNKYDRDDKRGNWASRQRHEKYSKTENVIVKNSYGDLVLIPEKIQERHKNKNLTHGDRDVASKIRDKAYTTERQRKDQERRYF